jgi:hypothetical protein
MNDLLHTDLVDYFRGVDAWIVQFDGKPPPFDGIELLSEEGQGRVDAMLLFAEPMCNYEVSLERVLPPGFTTIVQTLVSSHWLWSPDFPDGHVVLRQSQRARMRVKLMNGRQGRLTVQMGGVRTGPHYGTDRSVWGDPAMTNDRDVGVRIVERNVWCCIRCGDYFKSAGKCPVCGGELTPGQISSGPPSPT